MRWLLKGIQKWFPNLQFYHPHSNSWHLTIDDSPSAHTLWILDTLDTYQIKATFFCIGKNIAQYPEYFQEIVHRGHKVGYHSYYHINPWRQSNNDFIQDFEKCEALFSASLYRPPYGKITWEMYRYLSQKNIKIMLWDILTEDWKRSINPLKKIKSKIVQAHNGSIFVFHDNEKASENLKLMLPYFLYRIYK